MRSIMKNEHVHHGKISGKKRNRKICRFRGRI